MSQPDDTVRADRTYDSGNTLCGELALELRAQLRDMAPGSVLEVVARDPAARNDLPAWCSLTGHALVRALPPRFWIRRRAD